MAPKTGPSLKELMRNRNKVPSPKDKNKSKPSTNPPYPPPPQIPSDLGLKPNPDLRRKRHTETAEEGEDEHSCVQTSAQVVTYIRDTSDEEEAMAPKTGPSLKELMRNRNKVPSYKDKNKSKPPTNPPPPPPQIPFDLGLKPNPDLRKKRQMETAKEGELGLSKGSKQPRQS